VTCAGAKLIVAFAAFTQLGLVPIPIVGFGLAVAIGARWMPRRTAAGSALRDRVIAFRDHLRNDAFVNPAGAQPDTVARYLGYAMVFGLTKQWRSALNLSTAAAGTTTTTTSVGDFPLWSPWFADHTDDFTRTSSRALGGTTSTSGGGSSGGGSSSGGSSGGGGGSGGGGSW
jgi:uncharacterized membrane protein YgcG